MATLARQRLPGPLHIHPDLRCFLAVCLLAGAIRLPYLHRIPVLTDETEDVLLAAQIAEGARPLVSQDPYNGPPFHYLLAAGMALGGGPRWPRWFICGLGSLTVGLTYGLGASLSAAARRGDPAPAAIGTGDRLVGLIAAGLMAVSFVPVVVTSHVAWSNSSSPFWSTATLLAVSEALRRRRPSLLVPAGMLAGLAFQSHPSALPVLLAAAGFALWRQPRWLFGPWPWLALLAALIAVANLVAYNLGTGGQSIVAAQGKHYAYAYGVPAPEYLANLRACLRMTYQLVTSSFLGTDPEQGRPELASLLASPAPLVYGAIGLLSLLASVRQTPLPVLVWIAVVVVISLFNRGYRYYLHGRYLAAGLPAFYVAIGLALRQELWDGLRSRYPRAAAVSMLLVMAFLLGYPVARLHRYYAAQLDTHRTSDRFWQVIACLAPRASDETPIRLDRELYHIPTSGGGNALKIFDELLTTLGTAHRKPDSEDMLDYWPGAYLVLTPPTYDKLSQRFRLAPVGACGELAPFGRGQFDVWRMVGERTPSH